MAASGVNADRANEYIGYRATIATVFALGFAIIAVVLRTLARRLQRMSFLLEDHLIFAAVFFKVAIDIAGIMLLRYGLGRHVETLTPHELVLFLKTQYSGSFLYPLCICFVKCSILVQYRRVFDCQSRWFILQIDFLIVVTILWTVAICIAAGFICQPIRKLWEPQIPGTCFSLTTYYFALQIPNIITDLLIIILPIREVLRLDLSGKLKIGAATMFLLGIITLVFDIVRLVALIELLHAGPDITYTEVPAAIWTTIEPTAAIVAVCLPSIRNLYRRARSTPSSTARSSRGGTKSSKASRSTRDSRWSSWFKSTSSPGTGHAPSRASIIHSGLWTTWLRSQTRLDANDSGAPPNSPVWSSVLLDERSPTLVTDLENGRKPSFVQSEAHSPTGTNIVSFGDADPQDLRVQP